MLGRVYAAILTIAVTTLLLTPVAVQALTCDSLAVAGRNVVYVYSEPLHSQVLRLATHRHNRSGYSYLLVPIEQLASCGYGTDKRAALRQLLLSKLEVPALRPEFVVFVGTYAKSVPALDLVPTCYILDPVTGFPWSEDVPSDDPYVYGAGASDNVPLVATGRIPARTLEELTIYVDKLITYETEGSAAWKSTAFHAIEDHDFEGIPGGLVAVHADSLLNFYGGRESYFNRTILRGRQLPPHSTSGSRQGTHTILQAMNGGLGLLVATGTQGNASLWGYMGNGNAFGPCTSVPYGSDHSDTLTVSDRPTVALALVCGGGMMHSNGPCGSMAEYLLLSRRKGCLAVIGPSRAIRENAAYAIGREWFRHTFDLTGPTSPETGRGLWAAKSFLRSAWPVYGVEFASTFHLGDPSLAMWAAPVVVDAPDGNAGTRALSANVLASPSPRPLIRLLPGTSRPITVAVNDVRGRAVGVARFESPRPNEWITHAVDLRFRSSGVYFFTASDGVSTVTGKLVRMN